MLCHLSPRHTWIPNLWIQTNTKMFDQHRSTARSTSEWGRVPDTHTHTQKQQVMVVIHNRGIKINGICTPEESTWCAPHAMHALIAVHLGMAVSCANHMHTFMAASRAECTMHNCTFNNNNGFDTFWMRSNPYEWSPTTCSVCVCVSVGLCSRVATYWLYDQHMEKWKTAQNTMWVCGVRQAHWIRYDIPKWLKRWLYIEIKYDTNLFGTNWTFSS